MIGSLESFSGAFLYTHIDTVGVTQGIPMGAVRSLRASTRKPLIVAGGIATSEQLDQLDAMKIDVVVGMAIYAGRVEVVSPASGTRPHPNIKPEFD
jgi:phosphoribosylformimino-5-aminoimidazole carboxamide ribotide isomerase